MKRNFTRFFMSLFILALAPAVSFSQVGRNLCFSDGFGYVYTVALHPAGGGVFTGVGTSTAYSASTVTLKITLSSPSSGTIQMKVVNDAPDGCTNASDYYVYTGTVAISGGGGTGSGTWISYCSGSAIGSGTWVASGPCASKGIKPGVKPTTGAAQLKAATKPVISVTPNPVISQTQIAYNVATAGKVSITVYNSMQQPVKTLVSQMQAAGNYTVSWNASQVPAGVYKVVAVIGTEVYTSSIQVVR